MLVIDIDSVGLDFCLRCQEWGHEIRLFTRKDPIRGRSRVGDGLVEKVPHWEPHLNWSDLILITGNDYYLHDLEAIRKHYPVFGPPLEGMRLEIDRQYGMQVLQSCGIDVPPHKVMKSYTEAEAFIRKNPKRWVMKPSNDRDGNSNKESSYCSKEPRDLIAILRMLEKQGKKHGDFILQEFIEGIEIGVSCWFAAGKWGKINENFEFKKLCNDDIGPNTGEMGSALKYVESSKLFTKVLKPLGAFLAAIDYRGDIDVNCIVDKKGGIWPLEFTARLGWPAFYIMQAEHLSDPAQWMLDLMNGKDTLEVSYDIAVGFVLMHMKNGAPPGMPIFGIDETNWKNVHLAGVRLGTAPCLDGPDEECFVAADEYMLVASGTGKTVRKAKEAAKTVVESIYVPKSPVRRTDIGDRLKEQIPQLQEHNIAMEWAY